MLRRTIIASLILVIVGSIAWTVYTLTLIKKKSRDPRLNVMVLSMCSMRYQELKHYGHQGEAIAPEMDKFIDNSSFVFDNAFNGVNWIGFFAYTEGHFDDRVIRSRGYHYLHRKANRHLVRVPPRKTKETANPEDIDDNLFEKEYEPEYSFIRSQALTPYLSPFFLIAHFKYLHYPLIDAINKDAEWDYYLDDQQKKRVDYFVKNVAKFPDKLPLALLLTENKSVMAANPYIRKFGLDLTQASLVKLSGLINNPEFLERWKKTEGYEQDLEIVRRIYRANVRYLSKIFAPMFDLWGSKELQDRTVVILTGDHGEMHMEREQLTHATSILDQALKVPLAIRFPDWDGPPIRITEQTDFKTIARLVREIIEGKVDKDNFLARFRELQDDFLIIRDCQNSQRGLRWKNKWKYIVNMSSGERQLYDLEKDPQELANLADALPAVVDDMEIKYWQNYERFTDIYPFNCAPWVKPSEI